MLPPLPVLVHPRCPVLAYHCHLSGSRPFHSPGDSSVGSSQVTCVSPKASC